MSDDFHRRRGAWFHDWEDADGDEAIEDTSLACVDDGRHGVGDYRDDEREHAGRTGMFDR